jgi:hypothetical protein
MNRRTVSSLLLLAAAACSDPIAPRGPTPTGQITIDANSNWAYVRFEDDTVVVAEGITSPTTSTAWHMAFFGTNVMLNGGAAGPGNVSAYCVCANEAATDAQIKEMTAASELADFESITRADIPAATMFQADELLPVIANWYSGAGAAATVRPDSSWVISRGTGSSRIFTKFRVVSITGATAASPGTVNFEYATQPASGEPFGTVQARSVIVGSTPVYFSFVTGAVTTSTTDWDIAFDGFHIRLNSGVSGTGTLRGLSGGNAFATLTASAVSFIPTSAWRTDSYGGVFATQPWYRYNIEGRNEIWSKYNVYLIAVGNAVYKVQPTSYYNTAGGQRHVTMRYSRIR